MGFVRWGFKSPRSHIMSEDKKLRDILSCHAKSGDLTKELEICVVVGNSREGGILGAPGREYSISVPPGRDRGMLRIGPYRAVIVPGRPPETIQIKDIASDQTATIEFGSRLYAGMTCFYVRHQE